MPKRKGDRSIDPQPTREGRSCKREVEVPVMTKAPQMGETTSKALPLVVLRSNGIGNAQSISPFLNSPVVQYILESEMQIRPGLASNLESIERVGLC